MDQEAEPLFSHPVRQIALMLLVLVLVGCGAWLAYPQVAPVFLANPWLNGFIGMVFVIGVFACFWQVYQLITSVVWIEGFVLERPGHQFTHAPRLLASLAALLRARGARAQIGTGSARSILDSVATRIDEARDITRYIVNLLIFLGLLGTFYGLATTVPAVVDTIRSLAPTEEDGGIEVFGRLLTGLEAQLGGMGVAFASSLLGLAGSLVVGLLELFASHGQNRFYRELEDWMSTITRVGFAAGDADSDAGGGGTTAVLDHMAEQMDGLSKLFEASEYSRGVVDDRIAGLADSVERLLDRDALAADLVGLGLQARHPLSLDLSKPFTMLFDHPLVVVSRHGGQPLREKIIAGITRFDLDDATLFAQVLDALDQQHFHTAIGSLGDALGARRTVAFLLLLSSRCHGLIRCWIAEVCL